MSEQNGSRPMHIEVISTAIRRQYPGKYIVFSEDEQRVIGVGDTPQEADAQAQASGVRGMWHVCYADPPDVLCI